ncbi:uncharacterized protein ZMO1_ZMO0488 [Zymomonas mobilis subsp. mobilis ZM4 = ATCC 31821]|uniref:Lipoprotein n=1 Tax=Zymomonas mobilis subsp. mobilis (strain ATCC 31821 / ZM4 / CP4) TaxID=264203 RepID=Q5NQ93_ZYMMO|nr:hypothetical protein [Zymomonas mobilis]AAV89112.1 hypothetical protein ZMO0488 [Zymomonas mobilis subsp. mobilis ZM4 = ATCC 31821]AVZ25453.1 hypothetical protein ZMO2_ZMO0488 [Zymomonas mobilis subsp. mobilis]AVZ27344.1 hypothetical protein ZMO3_ZMO0488 [Zymomonas mobilis subsp. mobilis]AVZ41790.1 uncharacterized protein ZMO1_ZMO0488 [Zymomonas mobilis subsp. mobilis ZM4 = ATCC 31821]UBQ08264.1 hypothetical protein LB319_02810 [Zymomonas mobilis]
MRLTLLPSIVLFAAIGGLSSCHNGDTDNNSRNSEQSAQKSARHDPDFLEQHANDPHALENEFGDEAHAACADGANDYLREIELHDFSWDDDAKGVNGQRFDKLTTHSEAPYVLTLVSTRAKLANAFGGFSHITLYCSYDAKQQKVLGYSLTDPLLLKLESDLKNNTVPTKRPDYIPSTEPVDRSEKPTISFPQPQPKETASKDNDLDTQATNFLSEYYQIAEQSPEQAIPWMMAHYKPVVDFFGKSQSLNQIIAQKRTYLTRWPIRSYRLLTDTVTHQCNQTNMICQSMGTLEFDAQSPERKAASHGKASFVLSVDFSGNTPQITSENSQVISR